MAYYAMTPARRSALRKAQLASAAKRRGRRRTVRRVKTALATTATVGYTGYKIHGAVKQQRLVRNNRRYDTHLRNMGYGTNTRVRSYRPQTALALTSSSAKRSSVHRVFLMSQTGISYRL